MIRHAYLLQLPLSPAVLRIQHPPGGTLRHPSVEEVEALSELMLDAYHNTIDDEGEGTDEALIEVNKWFASRPRLDASWVYASGDIYLAASLVTDAPPGADPTDAGNAPLLAYIITRSTWKARGLGAYVVRQSLLSLQDAGATAVRAWVTEGNTPSERIMARFGFQRV